MAYILGLILTDGCVSEGKKLTIASIDYDLLVLVKELMSSEHRIAKEHNKNGSWYSLTIHSKAMVSDLYMLGIHPRKSLTCSLPYVPSEFIQDFVRGVFDGDGSVSSRVRHDCVIPGIAVEIVTGSPTLLHQLTDLLNNEMRGNAFAFSHGVSGIGRIRGNNKASEWLYRYMYYSDKLPCLQRKHDKFAMIIAMRHANMDDATV